MNMVSIQNIAWWTRATLILMSSSSASGVQQITSLCKGYEYTVGTWVHSPTYNFTNISYFNDSSSSSSSSSSHRNNNNVHDDNTTSSPSEMFDCCGDYDAYDNQYATPLCKSPSTPLVLDHGCSCRRAYYKTHPTAAVGSFDPPYAHYTWQPETCLLTPWNDTQFCELLAPNKTILFVGDSTMMQTYGTITSMIYPGNAITKEELDRRLRCKQRILWSHSDRLLYHVRDRGLPLAKIIDLTGYVDYIVFSTGPHHHMSIEAEYKEVTTRGPAPTQSPTLLAAPSIEISMIAAANATSAAQDNTLTTTQAFNATKAWHDHHHSDAFLAYFFPKLKQDLKWIREVGRRKWDGALPTLIYKTENPAHTSCAAYQSPIANRSEAINLVAAYAGAYSWHSRVPLEERFLSFAAEENISVIKMDPLFHRADGHPSSHSCLDVDCLHYLAPGPLNVFPRILLHKMVIGEL